MIDDHTALREQTDTRSARTATIEEMVAAAASLLPDQGPLQGFVHHNTLHVFEDLPFEDAVTHGATVFGTEPFQSEAAFHECLRSGRIRPVDIDAVIEAEIVDDGTPLVPGGPTAREFHRARLSVLVELPRGAALDWALSETDLVTAISPLVDPDRRQRLRAAGPEAEVLGSLWRGLASVPRPVESRAGGPRPRDRILATTGVDPDLLTHPVLFRLTAAYLDQGVAYWPMPGRDQGFLAAFRSLYRRRGGPPDPFLRGLSATLRDQAGWDAPRVIDWALTELGVETADRAEVVRDTLLSARGWAGMMRQFETRPDKAPVSAPPATLLDHLAVQLTLDVFAARHVTANASPSAPRPVSVPGRELVCEAFVLAQIMPVDPEVFADPTAAEAWLSIVEALDGTRRRRLLHLAYEHAHRVGVLDGLNAHQSLPRAPIPAVDFQAVFCLDEREESLRRHLEEVHPRVETVGFAGFFGVAMMYQGVDDIRARPLCPVVLTPGHLITEHAEDIPRPGRSRLGLNHQVSLGSRTLARGGLIALVVGAVSLITLIARCLFPLRAHRWSQRAAHPVGPTRLAVERVEGRAESGGLRTGYSVPEMVNVVAGLLTTTGMATRLSPLVLLIGHGSSSMNNPHESAHDCGATGGGRGGPNARAFAVMANHPGVRAGLRERGVVIPEGTWFVGAYHNTCDDSIRYYDEDLIPTEVRPAAALARRALAEACAHAAHERCRRFATAPTDIGHEHALDHVECHAVDLGQPRPEYGHATNAVCVVGRRELTRGLFLDRRAFLVSYDPTDDADGSGLAAVLPAAGVVCAGINLEYYFSFVDPVGYGCGTKLPHNIVGLLGVMDGHCSDLRTGLPWQMVEIHEPVRLLLIVEAAPTLLDAILRANPALERLVVNRWIQLVAWQPDLDRMDTYTDGSYQPYTAPSRPLPIVERSREVYAGRRGHLAPAHTTAAFAVAGGPR